jgi:hypothetical protein
LVGRGLGLWASVGRGERLNGGARDDVILALRRDGAEWSLFA